MRYFKAVEFWFASILTLVVAAEGYPLLWFCRQAFLSNAHDAFLGWMMALFISFLFLATVSCCGWEWLLFRQRLVQPVHSMNLATGIFCLGFVITLITAFWWSQYYN